MHSRSCRISNCPLQFPSNTCDELAFISCNECLAVAKGGCIDLGDLVGERTFIIRTLLGKHPWQKGPSEMGPSGPDRGLFPPTPFPSCCSFSTLSKVKGCVYVCVRERGLEGGREISNWNPFRQTQLKV